MAAALVGGSFLSAFLQVLFDRMASREFLNFFKGQKHSDKLLMKLKATLLTINIVLDDADDKQFTDSAVKEWLIELQDAVYHADDLVDEIATHEALRVDFEAERFSSTVNQACLNIISSFTNLDYEEMESKLENVLERLNFFAKHKDVLGLKQIAGQKFSSDRLPSTSLVDETGVYGRHDDQEKIIKLLVSNEESANQISVIPIVGMGGIGKTTLAQLVYNDKRVDGYFATKAWVCVSEPFDVFGITKTILEAVNSSGCDIKDNLNQLQEELTRCLRQRRFLFVLDDVWNERYEEWDVLQKPFRFGDHGSKIIVTTRIETVASMMQIVPSHHVQKLSDEDCWSLFSRHAFENGDSTKYPNLELIGKEIVKKCGGLPLAAKTLGGLLRSRVNIEEWDYIWKSEMWDLPNNKSNIIPALRLSYSYLPSRLKRCFAYCSVFPKDYEFEKGEVVLLWMAQNLLLQPRKSKMAMEELGDLCFSELLSRSLFQKSFSNESCFVMHDLIHDLAQFVSGEFCFRVDGDKQTHDVYEKVRYFSYTRNNTYFLYNYDTVDKFKEIKDLKTLQAFIPLKVQYADSQWYLDCKVLHDVLPTFRCLRVLSLSRYAITEIPVSIANLIHLRYFDVSYTKIKCLPKSVTTLYNLQTLLLLNCRSLTVLPQNMKKLICLRHLDLSGTRLIEMPYGMDRLKSLQFLSTFVVGKQSGLSISRLGDLCHLKKKLSIVGLENVINAMDAFGANLNGKNQLEELELEWSTCSDNMQHEADVLDKLHPHPKLKNLTIRNYGGEKFPSWFGENLCHNMVSLSLEKCGNCLLLPQLGQISCLKFLTVTGMKQITIVGAELFGDDSSMKPFQSLEILKFEGLIEWEEWHMLGVGEFPCLKELSVVNCPKLTGNLPNPVVTLRRLEISGCHKLVAVLPNRKVTIFCNQVTNQECLSSLQRLVISDIPNLEELPVEMCMLPSLEELIVEKCDALLALPDFNTSRLEKLLISECCSLVSLPPCGLTTCLKEITIRNCKELELPKEMEHCYTSIKSLFLHSCDSLKSFNLCLWPKLTCLNISGCRNFETLTTRDGPEVSPYLHYLQIWNCSNFKSLPSFFPSLETLHISDCPELECFFKECFSSELKILIIKSCGKLMACRKDWGLQSLPSLREFYIKGEFEDDDVWKKFPEEWLLPSALSFVAICGSPNLKALNHKGLQHLTSLKGISIYDCPHLESLPEEVLPSSISQLNIEECPLLIARCQREKGEDWPKIAHIPFIRLDGEAI